MHRPADPVLYRAALVACLLFIAAIPAGAPVGLASAVATAPADWPARNSALLQGFTEA
ncbi:hypothetical protein [Micromonospora sp. NPDC051296]|uniref:hypothetical protein n=1 Tax=Micromonospora sp. NPDC051296 TaxID=3155046 RepID=UPI003439514A